ncbi:Dr1-associated corepressor [Taenia solium]|eukprot:TsM_000418500 transcript=TsM_000418500 gene=TsM_000418500
MPTKRKFSAKFPTARIKKIMQLDDEIGKLSATVPPVVSRALELFIEQLLTKAYKLTVSRNSKTILPSYLKEVIDNEEVFAFLKPLVAHVAPAKSLEEPKVRVNSAASERKPKQRNGTGGRKRQIDECSSDCILSDESGPSTSSKSNGRRKCLRSKNQSVTQNEGSADLLSGTWVYRRIWTPENQMWYEEIHTIVHFPTSNVASLIITPLTPCLGCPAFYADVYSVSTFYFHC